MPDLYLYGIDGACSLIPNALLHELHIPLTRYRVRINQETGLFESADINLTQAQYLKLNPNGYVPTLVVDGKPLTEVPALLVYLANLALEKQLLGSTDWEKAKVMEWLTWLSGTLHGRGFAGIWRPLRFSDDESTWAAIRAKGKKTIELAYERIESRLYGENTYAVGGHLTVVDFFLHTLFRWCRAVGSDVQTTSKQFPRFAEVARQAERFRGIRGR